MKRVVSIEEAACICCAMARLECGHGFQLTAAAGYSPAFPPTKVFCVECVR